MIKRFLALLAITLGITGCGAPEQFEVRVQHSEQQGMLYRTIYLVSIADDPLPFGKVVVNDGMCNINYPDFYKTPTRTPEGFVPTKGKHIRVFAPQCQDRAPVYKVEYITQDGQSWTYNIE